MDVFGRELGANWVYIAAFAFALAYNHLIAKLHKNGTLEGFTWLSVSVGVAVTLWLGNFLIDYEDILRILGLLVASGLPMIIGEIFRYRQARNAELEDVRLGVRSSVKSESLAE